MGIELVKVTMTSPVAKGAVEKRASRSIGSHRALKEGMEENRGLM